MSADRKVYDTREAWLRAAAERTGRLLAAAGPTTVPALHVSVSVWIGST